MKAISESVAVAIVVAIFSFFGQLLWSQSFINTFRIYSTEPISRQDGVFASFVLVNQSDLVINDVRLVMSSKISNADIDVSYPINIEQIAGEDSSDSKMIAINGILARTTLLISVRSINRSDLESIRFVNLSAHGGKIYSDFELQSARVENFAPILVSSISSGVIMAASFFVVNWYMTKHMNSYRHELELSDKRLDEIKAELKQETEKSDKLAAKLGGDLDRNTERLQELDRVYARQRKYLIATLGESRRELEFWRSAFRTIVARSAQDNPDAVLELVRTQLKTYRVAHAPSDLTRILGSLVADSTMVDGETTGRPSV